jgi:hypothetical protein
VVDPIPFDLAEATRWGVKRNCAASSGRLFPFAGRIVAYSRKLTLPRAAAAAFALCATRAEPRHSRPLYADPGEGMKKSKNIQEPQNYENDHDGIQDRLDGACHRDETVNQPEENPNHDQDQEYVK